MNTIRRRTPSAVALCALAWLGLASAHAAQPDGDPCNPNRFAPFGNEHDAPGMAPDTLTGKPLKPGQSLRTRGTGVGASPELAGETVYDVVQDFAFPQPNPTVTGSYEEAIVASDTDAKRCKQHVRLKMTAGCIDRVRFYQYQHPKPIVANYRRDLPGQVASDWASRSDDGLVFEFHLKTPVCAPHTTRWLLLNTSINQMIGLDALELVTPDDLSSPLLSIHVPNPAP
ncbi:MAG: hypothetical protein U1F53_17985 [Burkholderiaceae bacterium]